MPSIRGTASVADGRSMSKALKSTKFPKIFSKRVDFSKVNRAVMLEWIEKAITGVLGFEDEIVSSTATNLFLPENTTADEVDPRRAQIDLAGFLGDEQAADFSKELWSLLLDAQSSPSGVPTKLLEEKKRELAEAKEREMQQQREQQRQRQQQGHGSFNDRRYDDSQRHNMHRDQSNQHPSPRGPPPPRREGERDRWRNSGQAHFNDNQQRHFEYRRGRDDNYYHQRDRPRDYRNRDQNFDRRYAPRPVSPPHVHSDDDERRPRNDRGHYRDRPQRNNGDDGEGRDEFGRALPPANDRQDWGRDHRRNLPEQRRERDRRSHREEFDYSNGRRHHKDRGRGRSVNDGASSRVRSQDDRIKQEDKPQRRSSSRSPSADSNHSSESSNYRRRRREDGDPHKERKRRPYRQKRDQSSRGHDDGDDASASSGRHSRKHRRSRSRSRD